MPPYRRGATEEAPQINMTPMVDVVLCLLIFFMAATRLYDWDDSQFRVELPEVSRAAPLTAAPRDLILQVVRAGAIVIDETTYDPTALQTFLEGARKRYPEQVVVIRADKSLRYQDLAQVLSVCEAAGIRNISLPVHLKMAAPEGALP
jgi:biopolymer transport protein ExbD